MGLLTDVIRQVVGKHSKELNLINITVINLNTPYV